MRVFTWRLLGAAVVVDCLWMLSLGFHMSRASGLFTLPLFGFALPHPLHGAAVISIGVAGACIVAGFYRRQAAFVGALGYFYVVASDWSAFHHHFVFGGLLLVTMGWSLSRQPEHQKAGVSAMKATVCIVYGFAGMNKLLGPGFRSGYVVEDELVRNGFEWLLPLALVIALGTIIVELGLPVALFRIPKVAVAVGVIFHFSTAVVTGRGMMFHVLAIVALTIFLEPRESAHGSVTDNQTAPANPVTLAPSVFQAVPGSGNAP